MAEHSLLVGGSTAARILNCNASFQEMLKQPQGRMSSIYAEAGTAFHDALAWAFKQHLKSNFNFSHSHILALTEQTIGRTFNERVISRDDFADMLAPAVDAVDMLCRKYGGKFVIAAVEALVRFPGIPDAFGSVDLILVSDRHTIVIDYKFGAGVKVDVLYRDGDAEILNEQLLYYATAAKSTRPKMFAARRIVVAIIQPPFGAKASDEELGPFDIGDFRKALKLAVKAALRPNPKHHRGEWCRFAECRATCPLWTGPLLDLSKITDTHMITTFKAAAKPAPDREWGAYLASAMRLVDSATQFKKLITEALMEHLQNGGVAPGYALKPATKDRKWIDDTQRVALKLEELGFAQPDIWREPQLQTFKVVDAAAKRLKVKIPDELRPKPVTTDMTLTAEGDPEALPVAQLTEEFRTALKRLRG